MNEPPHMQIAKEKGTRQRSPKIWLKPLEVAERGSLTDTDLNKALKIISYHQQVFIDAFNQVKEGKKVKTLKLK